MSDITFTWLYNQHKLHLRPIVEGPASFSTVQATELKDPTEFTARGAIVLTLGLAFESTPSEFFLYTQALAHAGVQGIGFGTGLTFSEVPPELIAAAQAHGLALFEVPRATAFTSIINAVTTELTRIEHNQQFALHRQQERLNQAAAQGLDALIAQAGKELGAAVAVADSHGAAVSTYRPRRGELDALPAAVDVATATVATTSGARTVKRKDGTSVATITNQLVTPHQQRFALAVNSETKFNSYSRALIRHLAGLTGVLLHHTDARTHRTLGALALATTLDSSPAAPLAEAFGTLSPDRSVQLLCLTSDSANRLHKALEHAERTGTEYFALALPGAAVLAFASDAPIEPRQLFGRATSHLRFALSEPLPWQDLGADLLTRLITYANAQPLGQWSVLNEEGPQWLHSTAVQDALTQRRTELFGTLHDYDDIHHADLARTLRVYALADAHLGTAATELGVHRHTIRARIAKIEELCHIDLSDPVTRAEVVLLCVSAG